MLDNTKWPPFEVMIRNQVAPSFFLISYVLCRNEIPNKCSFSFHFSSREGSKTKIKNTFLAFLYFFYSWNQELSHIKAKVAIFDHFSFFALPLMKNSQMTKFLVFLFYILHKKNKTNNLGATWILNMTPQFASNDGPLTIPFYFHNWMNSPYVQLHLVRKTKNAF